MRNPLLEKPDQPSDEPPLILLGDLKYVELVLRQMLVDRPLDEIAQAPGLNCVKLDGDVAEALGPAIRALGRPGRQMPVGYLLWRDGDALEVISASGASSLSVCSIFSPALTPDGSKSPRW